MPYDRKKSDKEYYQKNKEKMTLKNKKFNQNNPGYMKGYMKDYRKNNPECRKRETIYIWKRLGVISDDFDKLYDYYLSIDECENCGIELDSGTGTKKHLDHDHKTGLFRNILCQTCNLLRY